MEKKRKNSKEQVYDEKNLKGKKAKTFHEIYPPFKTDTLQDLINIAWNYKGKHINWFALWKLIPLLEELNEMVGMKKLKKDIIHLILYYVQGLHKTYDSEGNRIDEGDMLHTVLMGDPGTGKTSVAHILAKIYAKMGFLSKGHVTVVKRTDLIGKFVGHSEHQTKTILEKCRGGVMFIDEAYNLGAPGDNDCSFSSAAVNTLNSFLSEEKKDFVCIIAGYEKELNASFFSINPGLERRFSWRFTIEPYTIQDLIEIFRLIVKRNLWKLEDHSTPIEIFSQNKILFKHAGGDMEILFRNCKLIHTKRIFCIEGAIKRLLNKDDIIGGMSLLKEHKSNSDELEREITNKYFS